MPFERRTGLLSPATAAVAVLLACFCLASSAAPDETNLLACLLSPSTNLDGNPSPLSFAEAIMAGMNRPQSVETVSKYDGRGNLISEEVQPMPAWGNEGESLFTASERQQILDALATLLPDAEFTNLPPASQSRLLEEVQQFLRGFPTSVPGQSLTEPDRRAKLDSLRLRLTALKKIPVVLIEQPDVIAKQLSPLAKIIAAEAAQRIDDRRLAEDVQLQSEIIREVEEIFCRAAKNTATPVFKRPLPQDKYDALVATLMATVKQMPKSMTPKLPDDVLKGPLPLDESKISEFLDQHNRRTLISRMALSRILTATIPPILGAYGQHALTGDLATVDFWGGISEEEWNAHGASIRELAKHEQERQLALQRDLEEKMAENLDKTKKELASQYTVLIGRPGASRPTKWFVMFAFIAFNAFLIFVMFRRKKAV